MIAGACRLATSVCAVSVLPMETPSDAAVRGGNRRLACISLSRPCTVAITQLLDCRINAAQVAAGVAAPEELPVIQDSLTRFHAVRLLGSGAHKQTALCPHIFHCAPNHMVDRAVAALCSCTVYWCACSTSL